jgi:hypothetical protein
MDRDERHMQGYRQAAKYAVEWLHRRANEMGDPHAKAILNTAAFNLGGDFARRGAPTIPEAPEPDPSP